VKVYEKLHSGIWVYNSIFSLVDAWQEDSNARRVFKFRLELTEDINGKDSKTRQELYAKANLVSIVLPNR